MTVLYNYRAAVSEYQKLCREGSLSEWLVANGFATSKLTALILVSALKTARDTDTVSEQRCDELEEQIIERIDDLNFADKLHRGKLDLMSGGYPQNKRVEND